MLCGIIHILNNIFITICINFGGKFNMIEKIAMWGGVAGIVIAIFAVVILYLTRSNIIDLLDRDVVMYDKNYETKKESLQEAFDCLDLVAQNGIDIKGNSQFIQRAKKAYNGLLCTLNSPKLYQEFYRMAIDSSASGYSIHDIEKFKIDCRNELIVKRKNKNEVFKGNTVGALDGGFMQRPNLIASQTRPAPRPQPRPQSSKPQNNNE